MLAPDPVAPSAAPAFSRPAQLIGPNDPDYLAELRRRLVAQLQPPRNRHQFAGTPGWLSGDRNGNLPKLLEPAIREVALQNEGGTLAILTPEHATAGPLHALAEALEQLCPKLKRCAMIELPPAGWAAMVKPELALRHKRGHTTLIIDEVERLFDARVSARVRLDFLRVFCELAESPDCSVLFVIDQRYLTFCRELELLDTSLDAPTHIRVPVSGHPVAIRPHRANVPLPPVHLPAQIAAPVTHPAMNRTYGRGLAGLFAATFAAAMSLLAAVVFLGPKLREAHPWISAAQSSIAVPTLTPVSGNAAKPFTADGAIALKTFLDVVETARGPDAAARVQLALKHLTERYPGHSGKPVQTWLAGVNAGQSALATELGLLTTQLSNSPLSRQAALRWFEEGAAAGCPDGAYLAAETLFLDGQPELAMERLQRCIERFSDSRAAYLLGACHLHGYGIERNYAEARRILETAVQLGSANACQELGMMRERGLGGPTDPDGATNAYRTGAEAGQIFCMKRYAEALRTGRGLKRRNPDQAATWLERAERCASEPALPARVRALTPHFYR